MIAGAVVRHKLYQGGRAFLLLGNVHELSLLTDKLAARQ
jgi:hypothetical protein